MENTGDLYNIVTIQNIDTDPLYFGYNKKQYSIPAGKQVKLAKFLAQHATKHLIDQLLNKLGKTTRDEVLRAKFAAEIVVNEEKYEQPAILTGEALALQEADTHMSDLDRVLETRIKEAQAAQVAQEAVPHVVQTVPQVEEFAGLQPKPTVVAYEAELLKKAGLPTDSPPVTPAPAVPPAEPTREDIKSYAQDTLKADFNSETGKVLEEKINTMPIDELITQIGYPVAEVL